MKSKYLSLIVVLTAVALPRCTSAASTLTTKLVAHLKFDGDYIDATTNKINGTPMHTGSAITNGPSFQAGVIGQAVHITSTADGKQDDYVTLGYPPALHFGSDATGDTTDFSVAFWIKIFSEKDDQSFIGNKNWDSGNNQGWVIDAEPNGMKWNWRDDQNGRRDSPHVAPQLEDKNWHHVVVTFERTNVGTIYVDGVVVDVSNVGPTAGSPVGSIETDGLAVTRGPGWAVNLGEDGTGLYAVSDNTALDCLMDDVGIWRRSLTSDEVALIYTAGLQGKDLEQAPTIATYARTFTPPPGNAPPNAPVDIELVDVAQSVDPASVSLKIDGIAVTPTVAKNGTVTSITYTPPSLYASGSQHTIALSVMAGGQPVNLSRVFVITAYQVLPLSAKVTADTTKPGFIWEMSQVSSVAPDAQNSNQRTLDQLAGLLGPNIADPNAAGIAVGPGTPNSDPNLPIDFEIPTVISLDRNGNNWGSYTGYQMPGSPGTGSGTDNQAARAITYVNFPAGVVTMGVNSDDGFRTEAGSWNDVFTQQFLGEFDGGRGYADTTFTFVVPQAGTYALFTIWENGGGDSRIAWYTVLANGKHVLLNDTNNTNAFKCYRALAGGNKAVAAGRTVIPTPGATAANPNRVYVELVDGASPVDKSTVSLQVDSATVAASISKAGSVTTIAYTPKNLFPAGSSHTAALIYTENGSTVTRTWQFTVALYTLDKLHSYIGTLLGETVATPSGGGHTGKAGDYAVDFGTGNDAHSVHIYDATFLNIAATNDTMSFSLWVKKYDIANASAFWANSPSSNNGERGFQAHIPWSDDNIYFDTAGCCGADTRINANINTFAPYNAVGNDGYWTNWHHFLFSKKVDDKKIWIDGQLFFEGSNSGVLPTDFTDLYLGSDGSGVGNNMHGLIDDFAVFATAVSDANVGLLAKGTLPTALNGETLLAYWDFEDLAPSSAVVGPKLTAVKSGANIMISWPTTAGLTLKATASLTKPITWTAVTQTPTTSGNTTSVTVPIGTANQFFQLSP